MLLFSVIQRLWRTRNWTIMTIAFKVTPDFRGCPRGKNSYARHFKGKHSKLYIVGKLNKCRFQKKNINCRFLQFRKRKSQSTAKMTMCHSIELIGYQIQAHWQNNCTVLIPKDQSSKVSQHFSIF